MIGSKVRQYLLRRGPLSCAGFLRLVRKRQFAKQDIAQLLGRIEVELLTSLLVYTRLYL